MNKLHELKIWQKSIELAKEVYEVISELPQDEKYGLESQMKRCAVSVPSNIAEGAGRNSKKEFFHFIGIANGSLFELQTQLILSYELKMLNEQRCNKVVEKVIELQKMNFSFQKRLV
ncbi:four helix bundle protein [Flavobacterium sp.]|uniref:four helix bundle protein n=1 Tax=Flavobacterium sp. TaxID=239 RepID=UPI0011F62408|nr:four helix bundle protein [Flavobacterium sp.]RZJ72185.1 MAG: four helix bundle protein [Flavobacterium sp.]